MVLQAISAGEVGAGLQDCVPTTSKPNPFPKQCAILYTFPASILDTVLVIGSDSSYTPIVADSSASVTQH